MCNRVLVLAILMAIARPSFALADTAVATKWRLVGEAQGDCMNHAAMALFRAGFDKSEPGSQTMSGKYGDYTASIRCLSEQQIVFFIVAGPSPETVSSYLNVVFGQFGASG